MMLFIDEDHKKVYYKEQGGWPESIVLRVQLINTQEPTKVYTVPVKLTFTLLYECGTPVPKADILELHKNDSLEVIPNSREKKTLRFKIKEVSRNHLGQNFVIRLSGVVPFSNTLVEGDSLAIDVQAKNRPSRCQNGQRRKVARPTDKDEDTDEEDSVDNGDDNGANAHLSGLQIVQSIESMIAFHNRLQADSVVSSEEIDQLRRNLAVLKCVKKGDLKSMFVAGPGVAGSQGVSEVDTSSYLSAPPLPVRSAKRARVQARESKKAKQVSYDFTPSSFSLINEEPAVYALDDVLPFDEECKHMPGDGLSDSFIFSEFLSPTDE